MPKKIVIIALILSTFLLSSCGSEVVVKTKNAPQAVDNSLADDTSAGDSEEDASADENGKNGNSNDSAAEKRPAVVLASNDCDAAGTPYKEYATAREKADRAEQKLEDVLMELEDAQDNRLDSAGMAQLQKKFYLMLQERNDANREANGLKKTYDAAKADAGC